MYKTLKETEFPENIQAIFGKILENEKDFVGEKALSHGFLIKRNKGKATITYDDGEIIYAAKLFKIKCEWRVIGVASVWDNIQELLKMD